MSQLCGSLVELDDDFHVISGHDACVDILLENEEHKKFTGNPFSPLHCAV